MGRRKLSKNELKFFYENLDTTCAAELKRKADEAGLEISYPTCYRFIKGIGYWKNIRADMIKKNFEKVWTEYKPKRKTQIKNQIKNQKIRDKKTRIEVLKYLAHAIKINNLNGRFGYQFKTNIPESIQAIFIRIVKNYSYQIFPNYKKEIVVSILDKKTLDVINFLITHFDLPDNEIKNLIKAAVS